FRLGGVRLDVEGATAELDVERDRLGVALDVLDGGGAAQERRRQRLALQLAVLLSDLGQDQSRLLPGGDVEDVRLADDRRRGGGGLAVSPGARLGGAAKRAYQFPPGGAYFASHANTSLCQNSLFFGLSTQWPSSGKLMNFAGTFSRWSVVNSCCPSLTGTRKS